MTDITLPDVPDDSAAVAREMVEKLAALVEREPTEYNIKCLIGWMSDLAHPLQYKGEGDERLPNG